MKDHKKAEEIAVQRMQWLSPLLESGLDPAKKKQVKAQICEQTGWSERTLRRYVAKYKKEGFAGLKPRSKTRARHDAIAAHTLEEAILLRREVPSRSVSQIIQILEWEEKVAPGKLKRSTLQEKLTEAGYSSRQMRMYRTAGVAARRFQKQHRNALWQADIKFGPYLPIGTGGKSKQVYLVLFIDDATRYVMHGGFYDSLDQSIVSESFRQALQQYGRPEAVYYDNGKQFKNQGMRRICAKLGIRLLFTKPYSAESKGKVERANRTIEQFLNEVALEKPKTLDGLNKWFQVWLSECHQNKPHEALGKDTSPVMAFRQDTKALQFVDAEILADAFLGCEDRKVDKSGCVSFQGKKYEVGLEVISRTVQIVYDPADITEITIECKGLPSWKARELEIGERTGKRPALPDRLLPEETKHSRLLRGAEKQHAQRQSEQKPAISYRAVHKGGE